MTTGERMKYLRKARGLSAEYIAQKLGVSPATVYRYERGDIEKVPGDALIPIAQALHTTPAYLMGWEDEFSGYGGGSAPGAGFADGTGFGGGRAPGAGGFTPAPGITDDVISFPVLGEVAAGYDHIAAQDWEGERVDLPAAWLHGLPRDNYFVLRVTGDSMYPLYHDGDIVLVKKQTTLNRSGEIGVIVYDDECASLKKVEYVPGEDWMKLIPLNPNFPPVTIKDEALEHCCVLGVPVKLLRDIIQ